MTWKMQNMKTSLLTLKSFVHMYIWITARDQATVLICLYLRYKDGIILNLCIEICRING